MNRLKKLICSDAFYLRYHLLALLLLPGVGLAIALVLHLGVITSPEFYNSLVMVGALSINAFVIYVFILTVSLIQKENLVESRAYWRHLPIEPMMLLGSKLLSLALLVHLPVVTLFMATTVTLFGWSGLNLRIALGYSVIFIGLSLVAIVTATFTQKLQGAILLLLTYLIGFAGFAIFVAHGESASRWIDQGRPVQWLGWMALAGTLPAFVAAVVIRYRAPLAKRAAWACLVVGAVGLFASAFLPTGGLAPRESHTLAVPDTAALKFSRASRQFLMSELTGNSHIGVSLNANDYVAESEGTRLIRLEYNLLWEGLPETWLTQVEVLESSMRWNDKQVPFYPNKSTWAGMQTHGNTLPPAARSILQKALPDYEVKLEQAGSFVGHRTLVWAGRAPKIENVLHEPGQLDAWVRTRFAVYEINGEVPTGGRPRMHRVGGFWVGILGQSWESDPRGDAVFRVRVMVLADASSPDPTDASSSPQSPILLKDDQGKTLYVGDVSSRGGFGLSPVINIQRLVIDFKGLDASSLKHPPSLLFLSPQPIGEKTQQVALQDVTLLRSDD